MSRRLPPLIHRDDDVYVALCPEIDIASRGARSKRLETICAKHWNCSSNVRLQMKSESAGMRMC